MTVQLKAARSDNRGVSDADLLDQTRGGDREAFAELYRRHRDVAKARAMRLVRSPSDCEDIVAEAFAKILDVLLRGGGPTDEFRPYLVTCVRHGCFNRGRASRTVVVDPADMQDASPPDAVEFTAAIDASMVLKQAFDTVPSRWRRILWRTEVEDRSLREVSQELEMSKGAVASLSYRARKALSLAYLEAHVETTSAPQCSETAQNLPSYVRGCLPAAEQVAVEAHVAECARCGSSEGDLRQINRSLRF